MQNENENKNEFDTPQNDPKDYLPMLIILIVIILLIWFF